MQVINIFSSCRTLAALFVAGCTGVAAAASFNVPTPTYPHIYEALQAANNGDEIRVANDYVEIQGFYELTGKNVTIRSYKPDFTVPESGAGWETLAQADINTAMITITNATLTVEGFGNLRGQDCNVFMMGSNSTLNLNDSVVQGTTRADTAGVKVAANAVNVNVNCDGTSFQNNGRCIWFTTTAGGDGNNMSLVMNNCSIVNNSSWTIAYEPKQGNHQITLADCYIDTKSNRGVRVFGFRAAAGTLTKTNVDIDRCTFVCLPTGRYPISLAGYASGGASAADPNSTFTVNIRNSLFDLRNGDDDLETVAINSQDETADRKSEVTMTHSTVVFQGNNQCGVRMREHNSTWTFVNNIFDANGEGRTVLRGWRGAIRSQKNLLYARANTETAAGGSVTLSGDEITGTQAGFVDRPAGDFNLAEDSPCLDVGENLGILVDRNGETRPSGTGFDLGCYERQVAASVNNWSLY